MAIDAGYTITPLSGKNGTNGQNGASLSVQYSIDGTSNWHNTFASGDIYMRQKLGDGSWSSAMKIVGEDGQDGDDGTNGTNTWYSSVSATTSTTSIALSTITSVAGHSVAVGDLIIANSLVFLVLAVGSTNATVSYKQSIKGSKGDTGAKGDKGDTGAKGDKGDKGNTGDPAYSCETSASAVSVSTGTDRKPTAAGSVNIVFKAFKGTTALSAVASSSSTVSASQFRVTTPTSPQGGLTITQSTNGTLNIAWATGTAIDATRSIAITVAIGSTTNTVTKTITISASIKGATGGQGSQGSRAIRYIGKSATKPDSSNHTSATPVSGVTPIVGDWYLCTTDGYVYYCTKLPTSSANYYTWAKITSATDYRLLSCVDDLIVLHQTVTTNTVLNTAVDNYSTALATGTLLAQKIFTNSIKLQGDFKIYTDDNQLIANFENRGRASLSRIYCDFLEASEYVSANVTFNSSYTEKNNNHYEGGLVVGSTETDETEKIRILHSFIQALIGGNATSLQLQKIGGGVIIGDPLNNYDINDADELRVSSYLPFEFRGYGGNYPLESWCKVLGVYRSSLDLSSNKNKRGWSTGTAYKVGDIVTANSDYMRCITEHKYCGNFASSTAYKVNDVVYSNSHFYKCKSAYTSTSTVPSNDTTHWTDMGTGTQNQPQTCVKDGAQTLWISATQSGYIVFSNGLTVQWLFDTASDQKDVYMPIYNLDKSVTIAYGTGYRSALNPIAYATCKDYPEYSKNLVRMWGLQGRVNVVVFAIGYQ